MSELVLGGCLRLVTHPRISNGLAIEHGDEWITTDRDFSRF